MAKRVVDDTSLTAVADAIRSKGGTSEALAFPAEFVSAIEAIEAGGGGEVTPPTPNDGKTRVYIHLEYGRTSPMMGVCPNGTVTVDWGDGTKPDILTGADTTLPKWTPTHNYAKPGDYVITLTVDGEMGFYGGNDSKAYSAILRYSNEWNSTNRAYRNSVRRVDLGDFVTSIGDYSFAGLQAIQRVVIPDGVKYIEKFTFYTCYGITSVTFPDRVDYIKTKAFSYCYGVRYYDFTACTIVPTLENTDAFYEIPEDCEMLIPAALYDEWSTATNWATYANYMVAV